MDTNKMHNLKSLAEAATGGEWTCSEKHDGRFWHIQSGGQAIGATHAAGRKSPMAGIFEANAKFIAAASPATVLALLAEIERMESESMHAAAGFQSDREQIDQLKAENEALRQSKDRAMSLVDQLEIQHAELKAAVQALELDAERYRFVRNPIGTSSPLAIWNEGKMPLFSGMADAVVDEFMAKEASHD